MRASNNPGAKPIERATNGDALDIIVYALTPMTSRSRRLLAVAFLATALCADRAVMAMPEARTQPAGGGLAARFVQRLAVNFRRVVPAARVYAQRREEISAEISRALPERPSFALPLLSPFRFRLPPPAI
jgi:hypothetical protein